MASPNYTTLFSIGRPYNHRGTDLPEPAPKCCLKPPSTDLFHAVGPYRSICDAAFVDFYFFLPRFDRSCSAYRDPSSDLRL
jgi:hypothetical protein